MGLQAAPHVRAQSHSAESHPVATAVTNSVAMTSATTRHRAMTSMPEMAAMLVPAPVMRNAMAAPGAVPPLHEARDKGQRAVRVEVDGDAEDGCERYGPDRVAAAEQSGDDARREDPDEQVADARESDEEHRLPHPGLAVEVAMPLQSPGGRAGDEADHDRGHEERHGERGSEQAHGQDVLLGARQGRRGHERDDGRPRHGRGERAEDEASAEDDGGRPAGAERREVTSAMAARTDTHVRRRSQVASRSAFTYTCTTHATTMLSSWKGPVVHDHRPQVSSDACDEPGQVLHEDHPIYRYVSIVRLWLV